MNRKQVRLSHYDSTHPIDWLDAITHDGHIKGKAKVILTNEKTGRVEQIEHDNLLTDAVKNIFRYNFNMGANMPNLLPMDKLFGGVLLFRDQVANPTADMVYPWGENINPMVACAGDEGHNTRNPYRGNPNAIASTISPDGRTRVKVWEWNTSQGNGTIGSLSLTSGVCGNMGLKPYDYEYDWVNFQSNNADKGFQWQSDTVPSNNMDEWTREECDQRPQIVEYGNGEYGLNVGYDPEAGEFYERKVEHPFLKVGFEAGATDWILRAERKCSIAFSDIVQKIDSVSGGRGSVMPFIQVTDDYYFLVVVNLLIPWGGSPSVAPPLDNAEYATFVSYKISRSTLTVESSHVERVGDGVSSPTHAVFNKAYSYINDQPNHITQPIEGYFKFRHIAVNPFYMDNDGFIYATCYDADGLTVISDSAKYKLDGTGIGAYVHLGQQARTRATMPPSINNDTDLRQTSRIHIGRNIIGEVSPEKSGFYNGGQWWDTKFPNVQNGIINVGNVRHILFGAITPYSYPAMAYTTCYTGNAQRPHSTGYCYSNMYLATINSLQETVEKSSVMGMRVEYTLTVVS